MGLVIPIQQLFLNEIRLHLVCMREENKSAEDVVFSVTALLPHAVAQNSAGITSSKFHDGLCLVHCFFDGGINCTRVIKETKRECLDRLESFVEAIAVH